MSCHTQRNIVKVGNQLSHRDLNYFFYCFLFKENLFFHNFIREDYVFGSLLRHTLSYLPSTPSAPTPPYKSLARDHIFLLCVVTCQVWPGPSHGGLTSGYTIRDIIIPLQLPSLAPPSSSMIGYAQGQSCVLPVKVTLKLL